MTAERSLKPGWKMMRFGDIAQNIATRVNPAEVETDIYVGLEHLDPESLHLRNWGHPSDVTGQKLAFQKGDVIFGRRRAYQRKLAIAEFDGICSAHAMVLRAKPKVILPEFLPFFLQSDMFMERAIEISVGSLSPTINWKTLKIQEFPLPPLAEQQRIDEILWAADEAVEKYSELLLRLITVKSLIFRESLKSHSFPKIPCSKLFKLPPRNGYSPKTNASGSGFPTLSIGAVRDGMIMAEGNIKYAEISESDLDKFLLRPGDILVVRGNGNRELWGKAGIVSDIPENCFYPDLLIRITFDPEKILPEFAVEQWNDTLYHSRLLSFAKSTNGIWKINGKDLRQHELKVPPIDIQRNIVEHLSELKEREKLLASHINNLINLKRLLINTM